MFQLISTNNMTFRNEINIFSITSFISLMEEKMYDIPQTKILILLMKPELLKS